MADIFVAIENFLHTARSLGLVKYFALSYDDDHPLRSSCDVKMSLQQLVQKLNNSLEEINKRTEIPSVDKSGNVDIIVDDDSEKKPPIDDERLVQIRVRHSEMKRRISSFINRKRKEVNESNAREFCNKILLEDTNPIIVEGEINSCARIDAVFVPRSGSKTHVKVSRIQNVLGPQTVKPASSEQVDIKPTSLALQESCLEAIEERLKNMESHLKMKSENNVKRSVYSRLKDLEDRILFLEGLSPDYFHMRPTSARSTQKRSKMDNPFKNYSINELQERMNNLKEHLKKQALSAAKS